MTCDVKKRGFDSSKDFLKKLLPELSSELSINETVADMCKYLTNSQIPNAEANWNNFMLIQNMLA